MCGHGLIQDGAEGKDVGTLIELVCIALCLLWRHIPGRAQSQAVYGVCFRNRGSNKFARFTAHTRRLRRLNKLGKSEIENLGMTIARDHDVLRLKIAMHNSSGVRL